MSIYEESAAIKEIGLQKMFSRTDKPWKLEDSFSYSYWYIDYSIPQPVALVMFSIAILVELMIETTFYVMTVVATLLFDELQTRIQEILAKSNENKLDWSQLAHELDQWNGHHELVCRLVENIDDCFGVVLLITIGHVFITFSTSSSELIRVPHLFSGSNECAVKFLDYCLNFSALFKICHSLARLLTVLVPSHLLKNQVSDSKMFKEKKLFYLLHLKP